jgi:hypothetical protein
MSEAGRVRLISVIGAGECTASQRDLAEGVGRELARRGVGVVCGGRGGVMEAACRGAREEGALTVGILPGSTMAEGNSHLSVALPTGLGHARNALVVLAGEAVIAVGGGAGTLSEIAIALKLGKRVVGLLTWDLVPPDGAPSGMLRAGSAAEAVELALGAPR